MYAIIETAGKQYKVAPGQVVDVDLLSAADGDTVEVDKVLLIADGDQMTVGTPTIEGAKVIATAKGEHRAGKIIVFRYKAKVRYRKKTGHKQSYTSLMIDKIITPGMVTEEPVKKTRRRTKEVTESGT